MRKIHCLAALCALVLAACGGSEEPKQQTSAGTRSSSQQAKNQPRDMTAEEVAKEARGKVKCPAKVTSRPPKIDAVVDVVGVFPGMTYEEAENVVLCSHELLITGPTSRRFEIQTYGQTVRQGFSAGFAQPKVNVQRSARDYRREWQAQSIGAGTNQRRQGTEPGTARWYVGTMGLPGQERVINAGRVERFEEGKLPTIDNVRAALVKKYGEPTREDGQWFFWSYDPRGRRIVETSPLYHTCRAPGGIDFAFTFNPNCGLAVTAAPKRPANNPNLVEELTVFVIDQAGGYEALVNTERGLAQLDEQRRAKETEAASRNATAPTL